MIMDSDKRPLEGYLVLRPSGKFGLLKAKRKQWYTLDDRNQQLLYYPGESEVIKSPPSGSIPLKNAAISLVLDEANSFVLHADGKDYNFVAESHKSMLEWICTLQAKRDNSGAFLGQNSVKELREKYLTDHNSINLSLLRSKAQVVGDDNVQPLSDSKSPLRRTQSLQTASQIIEAFRRPEKRTLRKLESTPGGILVTTPPRGTVRLLEDDVAIKPDTNNNDQREGGLESAPLTADNKGSFDSEESENLDENYTSCLTSPMTSSEENDGKFVVLKHLNFAKKHREQVEIVRERESVDGSFKPLVERDGQRTKRIRQLELELMDVKCQLAKAVNRVTIYKNKVMNQEKDIEYLKQQIQEMSNDKLTDNRKDFKPLSSLVESQNRFLNDEVIKLSRQIQEQEYKYQTQQFQAKEIEAALEQLKRDYVFLMQSAIRPLTQEGPEKMEVYLYGGLQHKSRVIQLLNEARIVNSTLPTYDNTTFCLCHVDSMGFQHCHTEEPLILHYICRQLHHHYNTRVRSFQLHQLKWKEYLKRQGIVLKPTKELKELVRGGIPNPLRSRVWCYLYRYRVNDLLDKAGSHCYNNLCSMAPDSKIVAENRRQISLDLLRTLPNNVRFSHTNGDGIRKMQEVLQSFCIYNPDLGYCQGMNFLVAVCLLFMDAENSFWCLVAIVERYFPSGYYDCNLIGAQVDQEVLKDLMKEKVPAVYQHLASLDIEICTVTLNWFLAIFFDSAPIETVLRIWDCFLLEGPKVVFRFSLAIIKMREEAILSKKDPVSVMRQLKTASKLMFDVDTLMKVAFHDLEPFPCRKDIAAKQAYYLKSINERILRQDRERSARRAEPVATRETGTDDSKDLFIECATLYDTDKVLICYGTPSNTKVAKVNCDKNITYNLQLQFDSRIKSIHAVNDGLVLFGSISNQVYAYSTKLRKYVWDVQLNDSVLSISSCNGNGNWQVFAGLADGTVAVIQKNRRKETKPDTFYVSVGSSPVSCLSLINGKLWCSNGNRIVVLSLKTFDVEDDFQTSTNGMDYVSLVVNGTSGVWIALRGSSVIQLWDQQELSCRLLFDVSGHVINKSSQAGLDGGDAVISVSSLLQVNGCLIVGADEGSLFFYDVVTLLSRSSSAVYTPGTGRTEESPGLEVQRESKNENPFFRERNDSGCYSSTTTTLTLSRRESSTGVVSDKAEFENCYSPLVEQSNSNSPEQSLIIDEYKTDLLEYKLLKTFGKNGTRTNSDASTVVETGISDANAIAFKKVASETSSSTCHKELSNFTESSSTRVNDRSIKFENAHTSDSDPFTNSYADLDSNDRRHRPTSFNRNMYIITALGTTGSKSPRESVGSYYKTSRSSSLQMNRLSRMVAEIHEIKRKMKRKSRDRCCSMPDLSEIVRRKPSLFKCKSVSTDGNLHFASAETLCSITTWDSYEYDDLFVAYTDDEFGKWPATIPRASSVELRESTNLLLESLRCFDKDNFNASTERGETKNNLDINVIGCDVYEPEKTGLVINVDNVDSTTNQANTLRPNRSWTSCDESKLSSSTNGESHDESTADYIAKEKPRKPSNQLDFLQLKDLTGGNSQRGTASDTASVLSSISTEQPYSLDLVLVEKIKISDKPIKCLLKTTCKEELIVISCAGCYDDDEAILKWTREGHEKIWTNDPVVEVCPYTNKMRPSQFVRSRLPRRASLNVGSTVTTTKKEPVMRIFKSEPVMLSRTSRSASASQILHSFFSSKSKSDKK